MLCTQATHPPTRSYGAVAAGRQGGALVLTRAASTMPGLSGGWIVLGVLPVCLVVALAVALHARRHHPVLVHLDVLLIVSLNVAATVLGSSGKCGGGSAMPAHHADASLRMYRSVATCFVRHGDCARLLGLLPLAVTSVSDVCCFCRAGDLPCSVDVVMAMLFACVTGAWPACVTRNCPRC